MISATEMRYVRTVKIRQIEIERKKEESCENTVAVIESQN